MFQCFEFKTKNMLEVTPNNFCKIAFTKVIKIEHENISDDKPNKLQVGFFVLVFAKKGNQ